MRDDDGHDEKGERPGAPAEQPVARAAYGSLALVPTES